MKKFLSAAVLLAALCALNAANIIRGPYVEDAAQNTAVIKWAADAPTPAWVEYGPEGKCSQLMALAPKREEHSLTLHGLIPNTKFCYKIYVMNAEETGTQEPVQGTFKTLYSAERKIINFLVAGNTSAPAEGTSDEIKKAAAQNMAAYEADFIIHTGNIAADGAARGNNADFLAPFAPVLQNAPLLAALGGDEYGPDRSSEKEGRGFLAANYRRLHTMPWSKGTPYYYYIDTGNARLIFLDTNFVYGVPNASKLDLKSSQYEWLKKTLSTTDSASWKIVVLHHPVYSSGPVPDKLSALLAPLFEAYKVNLVIQGRQGAYERTAPILKNQKVSAGQTGPTYITVGGGGKLFEKKEFDNEWSSKYFEVPHFAHIQIVDRKLSLRVYTQDNKRIDALDIFF